LVLGRDRGTADGRRKCVTRNIVTNAQIKSVEGDKKGAGGRRTGMRAFHRLRRMPRRC
jgi:hypothetical protein